MGPIKLTINWERRHYRRLGQNRAGAGHEEVEFLIKFTEKMTSAEIVEATNLARAWVEN